MVNSELLRQLEMEGIEYKNAFQIANLVETEGISVGEAKHRVTKQILAEERERAAKIKQENIEKAAAYSTKKTQLGTPSLEKEGLKEEFHVKDQVPEGAGIVKKSKKKY